MPGGTPKGWARRCTFADDSLPHQIRLTTDGRDVYVSCNCRRGKEPFGRVDPGESAMEKWREFHG